MGKIKNIKYVIGMDDLDACNQKGYLQMEYRRENYQAGLYVKLTCFLDLDIPVRFFRTHPEHTGLGLLFK
jgi:hypothetical protein